MKSNKSKTTKKGNGFFTIPTSQPITNTVSKKPIATTVPTSQPITNTVSKKLIATTVPTAQVGCITPTSCCTSTQGCAAVEKDIYNKPYTVKDLLADSSRWIKGVMAKDIRNNACSATDSFAKCFCLLGAINKVYVSDTCREEVIQKVNKIIHTYSFGVYDTVVAFNDAPTTIHADVLRVLSFADI